MKNAKILKTILQSDEQGSLIMQLVFSYFEDKEKKYITTPIIKITSIKDIIGILKIAETSIWEDMIGKIVQIEIDNNNNLITLANIFDKDINIQILIENTTKENNNEKNIK